LTRRIDEESEEASTEAAETEALAIVAEWDASSSAAAVAWAVFTGRETGAGDAEATAIDRATISAADGLRAGTAGFTTGLTSAGGGTT
jgi:hypothetical protein